MKQLTEIRPKLKENALFLQTENGLFVIRDGPGFHIKGKTIARWISALRPHLNGEHTLEQILARLEPAQREHATQIVSMLLEKDILKDNKPEDSTQIEDAVAAHFQQQIHYIDHFVTAPRTRFQQFRASSILLYGSGETLRSLGLFLIRNGLRELAIVVTDETNAYTSAFEHDVQTLQAEGIETRVTITARASSAQTVPLDDYATIVYCADNGSLQEIAALNKRCVEAGRAFLALTPIANTEQVMLGPFVAPQQGPCWFCALLRLSDNSDYQTQAILWREISLGNPHTPASALYIPLARMIGHGLGFELFKILSGCLSSETERGVVLQNITTLESSYSPVLPHPHCPVCSQLSSTDALDRLMQVVTGNRDHVLTEQTLFQQHERLFSATTGLFTRFINEEIEQIPLKRAQITAGDNAFDHRQKAVTAFSLLTPFAAQMHALKLAIGAYSRHMLDTHETVFASSRELTNQNKITIMPQELTTWAGFTTLDENIPIAWLPAFSLAHNGVVYVPAAAVGSQFDQQGIFEHTTAGTAVTTAFEDLLQQGTLSALTYEYQQHALLGQGIMHRIDPERFASDADLQFLLSSAERLGGSIALGTMETNLPLHIAIAKIADQAFGSLALGLNDREAFVVALQKLVEFFQTGRSIFPLQQDPDVYAEELDDRVQTIALSINEDEQSQLAETNTPFAQLKDALLAAGRDILFVHTTSVDIWEEGTLISGSVLLTRAATQQQEREQ